MRSSTASTARFRRARAAACVLALLALSTPPSEVRADAPGVSTLVDTLRYDPESPTAPLILDRLGSSGERGWKALSSLVLEFEKDDGGLGLTAAHILAAGRVPKRLKQAARAYDRSTSDDIRAILAKSLASLYPDGAKRLHAHLRRNAKGSLALLRILAPRGLPRAEIQAALEHEALAGLARELLQGRTQAKAATDLLPRARQAALFGLDPTTTKAFAAEFRADPYVPLLTALAEVLREPDADRRTGAHCLLLTMTGVDIAPDAALWHSWVDGHADAYRPPDAVSSGAIAAAVVRGVRHLRMDLDADGVCYHRHGHNADSAVGATALAVLALRAAGVPSDDPTLCKAVETTLLLFGRSGRPGLKPFARRYETYSLSLLAMAMRALGTDNLHDALVAVRNRVAGGVLENGQWTYRCLTGTAASRPKTGDNSNTQYANLGLRAIRAAGVEIDAPLWQRIDAHWRGTQGTDGSWGYGVGGRNARCRLLPMTASGIAGLAIAAEGLTGPKAAETIATDASIRRGLAHLGRSLLLSDLYRVLPYSLYAVERACQLTGTRAFSGGGRTFDWYREGAWRFIQTQNTDGSWGTSNPRSWEAHGFGKVPSTAFALLFLAKATATVSDDVSDRTAVAAVLPEEVQTPPPNRAPPPGPSGSQPIPWVEAPTPQPEAVVIRVEDRIYTTRPGKVVIQGTVEGPWSRLQVGDTVVQPDADGRFGVEADVRMSGPIDVIAFGPGDRQTRDTIHVEIDGRPPTLHLVGPPLRHVGKQRLELEADEPLDGVKVGRYYFPADGRRVCVTAELAERSRQLVVLAFDRAGNRARQVFDLDVQNRVLDLDGKSAVRVDVRKKPKVFTLEAWVRTVDPTRRSAVVGDGENSGSVIFLYSGGHRLPSAYLHAGGKWNVVDAKRAWKWSRWTHLALTYDGAFLRFWVNGKLQGEIEAAPPRLSSKSFFIGAEPNSHNRAASYMTGAVDEVRLSDIVRYTDPFKPEFGHMADRHTLLLLHFDTDADDAFLDASGHQHNGIPVGTPTIVEEKR